jgi:hypothetical protein
MVFRLEGAPPGTSAPAKRQPEPAAAEAKPVLASDNGDRGSPWLVTAIVAGAVVLLGLVVAVPAGYFVWRRATAEAANAAPPELALAAPSAQQTAPPPPVAGGASDRTKGEPTKDEPPKSDRPKNDLTKPPPARNVTPLVRSIIKEIDVPTLQAPFRGIQPEQLPAFADAALASYRANGGKTPLREAVEKARIALWSITRVEAPEELRPAVKQVKGNLQPKESLPRQLRAPMNPMAEKQQKDQVLARERAVARLIGQLTELLEALEKAGAARDKEPRRWQANYDYVLAQLQAQLAYLYEYQSMMGQFRKGLPALDKNAHDGWRLTPQEKLQGDAAGKKFASAARKLMAQIVTDYPNTPWAELAKRDQQVPLGLDWQPAKL